MDSSNAFPESIGDFQLVRRIGEGLLGTVFEAKQLSNNRQVALKVVSSRLGLTSKAIHGFYREIEVAASFSHPNILPVYAAGEHGLLAYYTMEWVDGPNLNQVIRGLKLQRAGFHHSNVGGEAEASVEPSAAAAQKISDPATNPIAGKFQRIAEMAAEVADALSYAHGRGIVHRDIKPTNLLMRADGRLCLTDFALANILERPGMTLSGTLLTSPTYSSPEQIKASGKQPDHRTDIYSLGAVLYEWLTLQPPFSGVLRHQQVFQIIHEEPRPARRLDRQIPRSLETICQKAIEKNPAKRYASTAEMADDLRRFASHRRIAAHRLGVMGRSLRWCDRHRAPQSAMLLAALMIVGLLSSLAYQVASSYVAAYAYQREQKINDAIVVSFSGEKGATLAAIDEIESLGAPSWVQGMLLGQCTLFAGDPSTAVVELRAALELNPDSLETKAILATALTDARNFDELKGLKSELDRADPVTAREKLFLGNWIFLQDQQLGYHRIFDAYMEAAPELDPLALLVLAGARWQHTQDTFEAAEAEKAHLESQTMTHVFYKNPYVYVNELQAALVACVVKRAAKRDLEAQEFENIAVRLLGEIDKSFPGSQAAAKAWEWWAYFANDAEKRLETFQTAVAKYKARQVAVPINLRRAYALELFLAEHLSEAEREQKAIQATGETAREFLIIILHAAEGDGGLDIVREELNQLGKPIGLDSLFRPIGQQMLGEVANARRMYAQLAENLDVPASRREWFEKLIRFNVGEASASELIAAMDQPEESHFSRSEGHFFIGMHYLSEGDRLAAGRHFQQCLDARVFTAREYQIARIIVEKWRSDPSWPAWLSSEPIEADVE